MDRAVPTLSKRSALLGGLLLVAAAGPALAVLVYFQGELRRDRAEQARAVAVQQAQVVSASVDQIVEGARQMLLALSAFRQVRELDPACADVLHDLRGAAPTYSMLAVLRRDGTPVCSDVAVPVPADALAGLARPFLPVTGFVTGRYTSLPALAQPMVTFALPLHGGGDGPGILIAGMDLGRLGMLLAALDRPNLGRFEVTDRDGTVLADAPGQPGAVGRPATPVQRAAIEAKSAGATLYRDENGDRRIMGFVPPGPDPAALFVSTGFRVGDLVSGIDAAARRGYLLIMMGAALSVLLVLLALVIGHRYLRVPASVLLAAARRWGSGDLTARAVMPNAVVAEFAGLGHAFNEMAELLQQQRSELQALNEALEMRVADRTRALLDSNNRLQVEIAERELTEGSLRQAQKLQAVGQLAGGMAHEFNNVLAAILGSMELLRIRLGTPDTRQETLLDRATRAVERGSRLTSQLLTFSRKQPLLAVSVSVAEVIRAMIGLLESTLGASIRMETRVNDDLWPAMLDSNQFAASILNLALNARDAMPSGGRLRIAATNMAITPASPWSELAVGDYVCVTVSDSGTGMPPGVVNRAFEPFFTTKASGKGAGLGLSQVHGMVRQSGGSITIESRVGEGTEVRIMLPRGLAALPLPSGEVDLAQPAIERTRSLLLVDDDEQVLAVTEAMLVESGYTVLTAPEGARAIEILEQADSPVALVIADYAMPGVTGRELLRQVKQRWPEIAVLLATGYADYPELTSRDLPIDHIVRKPFRNVELLARIHLVMQRQASPEPLENGAAVE